MVEAALQAGYFVPLAREIVTIKLVEGASAVLNQVCADDHPNTTYEYTSYVDIMTPTATPVLVVIKTLPKASGS